MPDESSAVVPPWARAEMAVALLTGGGDKPYVFGLASELISKGVTLDLIGSDELDSADYHGKPGVRFLNLRGDQRPDAGITKKAIRVLKYYARLIRYAATAKPRIFHILWNNKFELLDRTVLLLYYKLLGKAIVLTVHNVNASKRDRKDTLFNRLTLRMQYRIADHLFVHSEKMKSELIEEFWVPTSRVTVVLFGINNAVPKTGLTPAEAKQRLGILATEKAILFFGNIVPYKGLEHLVEAFHQVVARDSNYRLIIAGKPGNGGKYWRAIEETIQGDVRKGRALVRAEFIPDEETEIYFEAADVLVLPYTRIYQSGVLILGYSFGLPALVADVGSLREEVVEGETGFVFRRGDSADLARVIERYFATDLYNNLNNRRKTIREYAAARHSWGTVGRATLNVYAGFAAESSRQGSRGRLR